MRKGKSGIRRYIEMMKSSLGSPKMLKKVFVGRLFESLSDSNANEQQ
jgi:hypothetical protein